MMLINLLKNAHESDSPPQKVFVEITEKAQDIVISVSDSGKGIAEARLNNVLIPFYSTKTTGSGLGLALCREIIDAHHGNIALNNREEGGLTVKVVFPKLSLPN
jgi:signal transduction histidine kinase